VLVQLGGRINWDRFFKQSDALRTTKAVSSVLHLMQTEWRTPLPEGAIDRIETPVDKIHLKRLFTLKVNARQHYAQRFRHLRKIKGGRDKVRYCLGIVFPARAYIIREYQVDENAFLAPYYLRFPFDLLWRATKKLILHRN
jgi:hypothetical protein